MTGAEQGQIIRDAMIQVLQEQLAKDVQQAVLTRLQRHGRVQNYRKLLDRYNLLASAAKQLVDAVQGGDSEPLSEIVQVMSLLKPIPRKLRL